jgi:hypothetical protein
MVFLRLQSRARLAPEGGQNGERWRTAMTRALGPLEREGSPRGR